MVTVLWLPASLLFLQAVHSYILLTANIDDLKNIGNRVVQSPIVGQVGNILRRAYDAFSSHLDKAQSRMRSDDKDIILSYHPDESNRNSRKARGSRRSNDLASDRDQGTKDQGTKVQAIKDQAIKYQAIKYQATRDKDISTKDQGVAETFSSLGKSASVYLEKIKDIFEKANPGKSWDEHIAEDD